MKYNDRNKHKEEQALTNSQPFKKFKGKCLRCGKQGHKRSTVDQVKENSMETVITAANLVIALRNAERRNETKTMGRNWQTQIQKR